MVMENCTNPAVIVKEAAGGLFLFLVFGVVTGILLWIAFVKFVLWMRGKYLVFTPWPKVVVQSRWAMCHRDALLLHCSDLEFRLHQLKFLSLLTSGKTYEALNYSKSFGQFSPRHNKEIKRLMGCFMFTAKGLEGSPYSDLLDPWHWTEVADLFAKDACKLLGLSLESPLEVSLSAGCAALPQLVRLQNVMTQRQVTDIWSRDELPCEVNLGWDRRYHSVFTCPILRQQSSESNPPVRLVCGHAISRDAMKKLLSHSKRLKCPYCPVEMLESEIQEIKF